MKVKIHSFENDYAVCMKNNGRVKKILKAKLPPEAKEGDTLIVIGDYITVDTVGANTKI